MSININYTGTKKIVLNEIFSSKLITRSELSKKLQLSALTISKAVTTLLADNIIIETDLLESSGGRKPVTLSINPHYTYILGIDIGSYSFKIGVVTLTGEVIEHETIITYNFTAPSPTLSFEQMIDKLQYYFDKYDYNKFLSICIAVSGMVDYNKQEIIFCPNIIGLDNKGIVSTLREHFKINVIIDTSARCMALGEKLFGCGKEIDNQLFISIGNSISSGMIISSQLFRGADGFSGEIGHIQVSQSNDMCTCGNYGCLELYATIPMVLMKAMKELQETDIYSPLKQFCPDLSKITMETIVKAYHLGDKTILKTIQDVGKKLGLSISSTINLFNPSLVIFGGGLIEVFPDIIDEVTRFVYQNSLTPSTSNIVFKKSNLDELSPIIGSACQIINSTFPPCTTM